MASASVIGARRQLRREEFQRKIESLAGQLGVELIPIEPLHWSNNADAWLQAYAQTRLDGQIVDLIFAQQSEIKRLSERVAALESAGTSKRAK